MAPARKYPYKNVTISTAKIQEIDRLRKQFDEIPKRPEFLGWMLEFVGENEKKFLRFAEKQQRDRD